MTTAGPRAIRDKPVCEAKTRAGTACQRPAGWGTDHPGTLRCKLHGGSSPGGRKAAARQQAVVLLGTLGVVEDPASLPTLVVHAELELSAAKQLAAVRWLERQVGDLPPAQVEVSPFVTFERGTGAAINEDDLIAFGREIEKRPTAARR